MKRNALSMCALILLSSTTGCGCCSWLWPRPVAPVVAQPVCAQYAPACDTCNECCDPCSSGYGTGYSAGYGSTYGAPAEYGGTYAVPGAAGY